MIFCGSRQETYNKFFREYNNKKAKYTIFLLVDSEGPVTAATPALHLRNQPGDGWSFAGIPDERVHLMVQTMETWIVADPQALAGYYEQGFRANGLPKARDLEAVPKPDVADALDRATERTTKGRYRKIRDASALLARIDPAKVRQRCRHCGRLFDTLERLLAPVAPA